ncbi:flavin reductase family protein [Dysgonomonas sp. Marseille-P4677]|uniref:flavin reductase n=1 Tax=Dysgonomonas sp. Marseille-P4677 TaxID=2364790 RepID=UPI0019145371|nr:flavin reductase family protein [Dysgonomonas sp. Marseille-P4677]MBK5722877.1 flavin reductase family protein [Dysgonomonas sp. Marseille-P4677]
MNNFNKIGIKDFTPDSFGLKDKWMLISAAKPDGTVNTMTASWGGFGVMWNKEVAFVVIRPQRYTKEFVDSTDSLSLTFFDKSYLKALGYLGKVSGRDEDKIAKMGLTTISDDDVPYFEEANTVIIAKKLFVQKIEEEAFLDKSIIERWYPEKDFHYLYIAEITKILQK